MTLHCAFCSKRIERFTEDLKENYAVKLTAVLFEQMLCEEKEELDKHFICQDCYKMIRKMLTHRFVRMKRLWG